MHLTQFRTVLAAAIAIISATASCTAVSVAKQAHQIPDKFAYWADPRADVIPDGLIKLAVDNLKDVKPQWSSQHFGVGTIGFGARYIVLFGSYEKGNRMQATVLSRYDDSFKAETPGPLARLDLQLWVLDQRIACDS